MRKPEGHHDMLQPAVLMVCFSAAAVETSALMCWHMPENHCSINARSMCIWQACCWVCPPVVRLGFYILHILTLSACKWLPYMEWLRLWAVWLAIGQIVLPVGRFSVHSSFLFFFFQSPLPFPLSSYSLARGCTRRTNTHFALCWPFSGWFLGPFFKITGYIQLPKKKCVNPFEILGFLHKLQSKSLQLIPLQRVLFNNNIKKQNM